MDKWKNSVAVVTGANSGCGLDVLKKLATLGLRVVGLDIKLDNIEQLKAETKNPKIYSWPCDVTKDDITEASFKWVEKNVGPVDILVNCVHKARCSQVLSREKSMSEVVSHIDVNYTAVIRCTRLVFASMEARESYGYVVNVSACCGDASAAIKSTMDALRQELRQLNNRKVRITNISPGAGLALKMASGENGNSSSANPSLKLERVGDAVGFLLSYPYGVNITDLQLE